jgi:hypothetical protein
MRIPPNQVFVFGKRGWEEFDCLQEPLPDRMKVLLCLVDGAQRRRQLQAKLNTPRPSPKLPNDHPISTICAAMSGASN